MVEFDNMITDEQIFSACRIRQEIENDIISKNLGKLAYYCNWHEISFISSLGDFIHFRCDGQFLWEYFFKYDIRILEIEPTCSDSIEIKIDSEDSDGYYRTKIIPVSSITKTKEDIEREVFHNLTEKFEVFTNKTLEYIQYYENIYAPETKKLGDELNSKYRNIFNLST